LIVTSGSGDATPPARNASRIKFTTDDRARAKGQKIAIVNTDAVKYFLGVNPSWDATKGPWHLCDVKGFESEPDRMDKPRSEPAEKREQAVPAPWLAGTESVKTTGQCTSPLEILLVEDDAGDTMLIHEIVGELTVHATRSRTLP
jgi:hypothetical protein